jgi:4'-phosphopantetheinyl transferase
MSWDQGPRHPRQPGSEVHIWRAELDRPDWPGEMELPANERERAATMLRPLSRRRWVAARWALRSALARYGDGVPERIGLTSGENGKPSLAGDGSLRFNLSHSAELALIAVATDREVGVDIERIEVDRDLLSLARLGLDPRAATAVRAAPAAERPRVFYAAWVRREAVGKCFGSGLAAPPPNERVEVYQVEVGPDWAAAVAVAGANPLAMRRYALDPDAGRALRAARDRR